MFKRIVCLSLSIATGLLASAALLVLAQHPAGTVWAAPDAGPLADILTVGGPCGATIQACLDAASPGDEVHIPAGDYTESVTVAKSISVTGDLSSTTIIHALDNQRVMTITNASVYVADLMLTGGVIPSTSSDYSTNCGGGLRIYAAGPALLHNVAIVSNTAYCGGGLGAFGGAVTLDGVDIAGNTAGVGGGVSARYIVMDLAGGRIRNNIGTYAAGGIEQQFGQVTMSGGEIFSNSTDYVGGGVLVSGQGAMFTQTGGSLTSNLALRFGGGLVADGGTVWLLGGTILSNSAPNGGGIAIFSEPGAPGQMFLSGGTVAGNQALAYGGGIYLTGAPSTFTQTSGSIEQNAASAGGGLYQDDGSASISHGAILTNSAGQGGGLAVNRGTLVIANSRLLGNAGGGSGAGAIQQFDSGAPVSVAVSNSCIAGNGPLASVVNAGGPSIDARGNWWGAADGPSGAGSGSGDPVSSGVDFSGFLALPPVPGCPAPTADLSVAVDGTGSGSVSSTPAGIDCGATCSATFYQNSVVTLTATPAAGSRFAGWSGACAGVDACVVTMTQATQVTATFLVDAYTLAVASSGTGSGLISSLPTGISCGVTCSASFNPGTIVTLTATPGTGSRFVGWAGACAGVGACVVTISGPTEVTAAFALNSYSLTVGRLGSGAGVVTSEPDGISCGVTCSGSFNYGTVVTLTATPALSSTFTDWTGACSGAGLCVLSVSQAAAVTATFSIKTIPVTVQRSGNGVGSITSQPAGIDCGATCSSSFTYGTVITLTAKAAPASRFDGWQGACAGLSPCVLTLTEPAVVSATFSLRGHKTP